MSIEKEVISHEKQKDITIKQCYSSHTNLNLVDVSKKYISFLTKNAHYKYKSKKKNGSLYELFTSEYFTIDHLIYYLIYKEEIFIIDFITNLLYEKFKKKTYYYLP